MRTVLKDRYWLKLNHVRRIDAQVKEQQRHYRHEMEEAETISGWFFESLCSINIFIQLFFFIDLYDMYYSTHALIDTIC